MSEEKPTPRKAVILAPGQGRAYPMGRIRMPSIVERFAQNPPKDTGA
jgi:hypothetical protein